MWREVRITLAIMAVALIAASPLIFAAPASVPSNYNYLAVVFHIVPPPTATPVPTNTPAPKATPTPVPTDTPVPPTKEPGAPTPDAPCDQNAPAPANGAQAWMTVSSPARFSMTTLCVRLISNGQVVSGASASGVAHYKTTNTSLGPSTTGSDGVAHMTFSVGGASAGFTVVVDAAVGERTAQTSFTPH